MKKLMFILPLILVAFLLTTTISKAATAKVVVFIKVGPGQGNGYNWISDQEKIPCEKGTKNTCGVYTQKTESDAVINPIQTGGWSLTTEIYQLTYKSIGITPSHEITSYNNTGFEFNSNYYLKITECSQYPQLVNVVINLDGVIIDSNQDITVYVPPVQ